jgi:hypothetical protein
MPDPAARAEGPGASLESVVEALLPLKSQFAAIAVAVEELEAAGLDNVEGLFLLCRPRAFFEGRDRLYRAHVRELISRYACDEDMRPGTDAECLCALVETSFRAPLNSLGAYVYEFLFGRVIGQAELAEILGDHVSREPWPGAGQEMLVDLRRKMAVAERKL